MNINALMEFFSQNKSFSILLIVILFLFFISIVVFILRFFHRRKMNNVVRIEPVMGEGYFSRGSIVADEVMEGVGEVREIAISDLCGGCVACEEKPEEFGAAEEFEFEEEKVESSDNSDVAAIYILADADRPYLGYELLQSLLLNGFRFGDQNIFHRVVKLNENEEVVFSLAQATRPGTFDLNEMGGATCPGLVLFAEIDKSKDVEATLDSMLEVAEDLAEELGGGLYDISRNPVTAETVAVWKDQAIS